MHQTGFGGEYPFFAVIKQTTYLDKYKKLLTKDKIVITFDLQPNLHQVAGKYYLSFNC